MNEKEWHAEFGGMVRAEYQTSEFDRFFSTRLNNARARLSLTQMVSFIRHRRDCWAFVSGNCPEMIVKKKILAHEYDEIVKDEYSEYGHLDLVVRQGKTVGLSPEQVLSVEPLPTTRSTLLAWGWLTRERPWLEGLAAMMVTEWANDNRLLEDLGGGLCHREGLRWIEDLGLTWKDIPYSEAHAEADEKHGDMFLPVLVEFGTGHEKSILNAARDSMQVYRVFRFGLAVGMEGISLDG